jgi:Na+-driven multidrug efflux pump
MVSTIAIAVLGGVGAVVATAVGNGDAASAAHAAAHAIPPGLHVALSHVPSWTHAHEVLAQHLQQYGEAGSAGSAGSGGIGLALKKMIAAHFHSPR